MARRAALLAYGGPVTMPDVLVCRAADRQHTRTEWLDSAHSFSFGHAYDPDNLAFGPLLAHNEDLIAAGSGYDLHRHRDTEILTWVLEGELTHRDDAGRTAAIGPGSLQWLSAGTGIGHSERNDGTRPLHLVQMWLTPDEAGAVPEHRVLDVAARLSPGTLQLVASGTARRDDPDVVRIRQPAAALWIGRIGVGDQVELPAARRLHLFTAHGTATLVVAEPSEPTQRIELSAGDTARLSTAGSGARACVIAVEPAEVLIWQFGPG